MMKLKLHGEYSYYKARLDLFCIGEDLQTNIVHKVQPVSIISTRRDSPEFNEFEITSPMLSIPIDQVKDFFMPLLDMLAAKGIRSEIGNKDKAIENHLEDMRTIAFRCLSAPHFIEKVKP